MLSVGIPADACTVAGISIIFGIPTVEGLHSAVDVCLCSY